jgi:hypothetical protein
MDVGEWLRTLGLEQYEPAFRANEIDETVLASLTAEDLKDLGVTLVGHRQRLLDGVVALGIEARLRPSLPIATIGGSPHPNPPPLAGRGGVRAATIRYGALAVEPERRQGPGSVFQRRPDRLRVAFDYAQVGSRNIFRLATSLFPILEGPQVEHELSRKTGLTEA